MMPMSRTSHAVLWATNSGLPVYGKTALPSSRYAEPPTVVTVTSCR